MDDGNEETVRKPRKVSPHRDTLWLSGADAINLVFGIIIHVILTRSLLNDDYGTFVLLLDFFHVCVILVDLGLPTLIARDGGKLGTKLQNLLEQVFKIQSLSLIIVGLLAAFVGIKLFGGWIEAAIVLAIGAGLQVLAYSVRAGFRSLGEARLEAIIRIIDRGVVALLIITWADSISQFALATALGPLSALIIALILWNVKGRTNLKEPEAPLPVTANLDNKMLINTGLPFLFASAALIINVRIEKLLLGLLATPEDVAIYQIAWLGFIAGYGPILSLRAVLLSWFGEVRDDLEKLTLRYSRAFTACAILGPVGVGIGLLIGPLAITSLFPDYSEMVEKPFLILLLAWLFHTMATPSLALIQVGRKPWNYTRILWSGIAISTVACLFLITTQSNAVLGAANAACFASICVFTMAFTGVSFGWAAPQEQGDNGD
jgi:O-antigen/teichoic acid export membrane protein